MTHLARVLALTISLGATLAMAQPTAASAQEGPAGRYLKGQHERVNRMLARPAPNDHARARRNAQITGLIGRLLDYDALSQEALSDHWQERSEPERAQFVGLLRQLVERSYQRNLESTTDYRIRYGDEEPRAGAVVLHTTARSRNNRRAPEVAIDYRMRQDGNRWVVVDVVTDGVSMVRNYRNQFDRIIRRDGWSGLIERMERRLGQNDAL